MVGKVARTGKASGGPNSPGNSDVEANLDGRHRLSSGREESDVGAAGADLELNPLGTLGAVAHVRGVIAIRVDPGINVATGKVDPQEGLSPLGTA